MSFLCNLSIAGDWSKPGARPVHHVAGLPPVGQPLGILVPRPPQHIKIPLPNTSPTLPNPLSTNQRGKTEGSSPLPLCGGPSTPASNPACSITGRSSSPLSTCSGAAAMVTCGGPPSWSLFHRCGDEDSGEERVLQANPGSV